MRWLLDVVCRVAHFFWWVPGWNRVHILTCPVGWACHRFPRFERWYWRD